MSATAPARSAQREKHKQIPHVNNEAERGVLGAMLIDPSGQDAILALVDHDDFYEPKHQTMCEAITAVREGRQTADVVTVDEWLRGAGRLAEAGGSPYVHELVDSCGNVGMGLAYARIVLANSLARQAQAIGSQLVREPHQLDRLMAAMEDLARRRDEGEAAEHMFTMAQLRGMDLPLLQYVAPLFLPEGLAILASKGKIGKSWLAYALAIATATGGVWLGQRVAQGDALYLALEDSKRRLQGRGRVLLGEGAEWPNRLTLVTKWERLGAGGEQRIERWLKHHDQAKLVVIDVFAKVKPPRSRNGDPYAEDYEALEGLQALAQAYHVAIVVIHHTRKASAEDAFDELNGTSGLAGAADTLLVLQRPRDEAQGVLHVTGREIADETSYVVRFNRETCAWQLADDQNVDPLRSQEAQDVITVLKDAEGPMTPNSVADALKIPKDDTKGRAAVRQRLSRMADRGEVGRASFGRYRVGDKSVSHLSHSPSEETTNADDIWADGTSKSVTSGASPVTLFPPSVTPSAGGVTLPESPDAGNHRHAGHAEGESVTGVTASATRAATVRGSPVTAVTGRACYRCGAWLNALPTGGYEPCTRCTPIGTGASGAGAEAGG